MAEPVPLRAMLAPPDDEACTIPRPVPRLRYGGLADAAQVLRINAEGSPGVSRLTESELASLTAPPARYLVAEAAGQVIGYLIALPSDARFDGDEFRWFRWRYGHPFLYIDQVAVAAAWRGEGLGSRLYRHLEAWAARLGTPLIACELNLVPPNPGSARFHDRHGYHQVGTLETRDGRLVSLRCRSPRHSTARTDVAE
jgi:uncharacterized protein